MRAAVIAVVLLAAVACASAFIPDVNEVLYVKAAAIKADVQSKKFTTQATYGNPCGATAAETKCTAGDSGCGWDSACTGADQATGTCQYLSVGLSCGSTCMPRNSTSGTYPSPSQCPFGTQCAVTGADGTAYTCGFGSKTNFALLGCSCTSGSDCRSGSCQNSVCSLSGQGSFPTGATCVNSNDCASGTCTSGACAPKTTCSVNADCAVGKVCNTTSAACVDPIPAGGQCYVDQFGRTATPCANFGECYAAPREWGVCTDYFSQGAGAKCWSQPLWCGSGLACDVTNGNGTCFSGGVCGNRYGALTCPVGQHCACSGTTPTCQGPTPSSSCVSKLQAVKTKCANAPRTISGAPGNFLSASIPSDCAGAQADFFCDRDCAGPNAAFGGPGNLVGTVDYRVISCSARSVVAYAPGQNLGCTRAYCPEAFNAAGTVTASAAVVVAAVAAAVLSVFAN